MSAHNDINKINALRRKLRLLATGGFVGLSLFTNSPNAQAENKKDAKDPSKITTVDNIKPDVKHFLDIIEITSLEEMANYPAATFDPEINGIVYTQFTMPNASESQQAMIDAQNKKYYSVPTKNHEEFHAVIAQKGIRDNLYNGERVVTAADRIRLLLMEEIISKKLQKDYASIVDAIDEFKNNGVADYYVDHYMNAPENKSCSILVAMMAEEKCPEQIFKQFVRDDVGQQIEVDGKKFSLMQYKSVDGKFTTSLLLDNGKVVKNIELLNKLAPSVALLHDAKGEEIKTADGKSAKVVYDCEFYNEDEGKWYDIIKIPNINKETQGYSFNKLKQNFTNTVYEYAKVGNLNSSETSAVLNYLQTDFPYLDIYLDMPNDKIKEIKGEGRNLPDEVNKAKKYYNNLKSLPATSDKCYIPVDPPGNTKNIKKTLNISNSKSGR